jgi:shikimate dehydrogenase
MSSADSSSLNFSLNPVRDNYAVMGNPLAHSKSPVIHKAFAEQTGQELFYQAIHVPEGLFDLAIKNFAEQGGKGLNITVPFKVDACQLSYHLSPRASLAMAVNTLSFADDGSISGDNTDGVGLVRDVLNNGIIIEGKRILIIGAGGAARGVLGPLNDQLPESIVIANRTVGKAQELALGLNMDSVTACGLEDLERQGVFDLIINGTSSSLKGEMPSLPTSIVSSFTCCYDMAYGDNETVFNLWGKTNGAAITLDGLGMLVEQAAESFYIWRAVRPNTKAVIEMLKKRVKVKE